MSLKILIVAPQPFFQERGTPIAVCILAETLSKQGHKVDLLVFHEGADIEMDGVTIHRIKSVPFLKNIPPGFSIKKAVCDILLARRILQLTHKNKYDILHAVEEAAYIVRSVQSYLKVPYIIDMDSSIPEQLVDKFSILNPVRKPMEKIETWAVAGSIAAVVMCKALQDRVYKVNNRKPVLVLEDVSMITDKPAREDLRDTFNISGRLLLYIGNLESYQGIELLIHTFHKLDNNEQKINLVIIGGDDKSIEYYRSLSNQLNKHANIFFAGPRPITDLGAYLQQADILVSPRTQGKNTPMKIYSYLDSGRPVVATRIPSHTQVIDDEIAMLAKPEPNDMAKAIQTLLHNQDLRKQLARKAKKRIAEYYSLTAFERKLSVFYNKIEYEILPQSNHLKN